MEGYYLQLLKDEDLIYLTLHDKEDGILYEGFFHNFQELHAELVEQKISPFEITLLG